MSVHAVKWALTRPVSVSTHKLVLVALADYANMYGECWPKIATLANILMSSRRTVDRAIAQLEADGYISHYQTKSDDATRGPLVFGNVYRLNLPRLGATGMIDSSGIDADAMLHLHPAYARRTSPRNMGAPRLAHQAVASQRRNPAEGVNTDPETITDGLVDHLPECGQSRVTGDSDRVSPVSCDTLYINNHHKNHSPPNPPGLDFAARGRWRGRRWRGWDGCWEHSRHGPQSAAARQ